jgi:senataxin
MAHSSQLDDSLRLVISSVLDIHAKFITTVALRSDAHPGPIWSDACGASRTLLGQVFRSDGRDMLESLLGLSLIANEERKRQQKAKKAKLKGELAPQPIPVTSLHRAAIRKEVWAMAYNALSPTDPTGAAIVLNSVASYAHIEKLNRDDTWSYSGLRVKEVVKEDDFVAAVRAINAGLVVTRDPFAHALESLAMQPDPTVVKRLWDQPGVPFSAILLLLSPAEDVHDPTISLIQQSFDNVDDRADCFRTLLNRFPAQAMDGLCDFLASFIDLAKITPESCSLAKWLVRCFTDILDALCQASEDGEPLLQSSAFLSVYADGLPMSRRVANLWHLMTTALAVIFKRTIDWAPFYDNETMVDWMRDALIFGRQMAEHIRAFEAAALGVSAGDSKFEGESPLKPTKTGAKLVQKLEVVLRDLVSWLRLTE